MSDSTDAVTVRLRRALGIGDQAPAGSVDATRRREQEDAALAAWTTATASHDRAVRERGRIVRRASAVVERAMLPLASSYYRRIEARLGAEDWIALARFDGRNVAHVAATRAMVSTARTTLAVATSRADATLASARACRTAATENLIATLGLDRAASVTGLSQNRLAALRSGR